MEHCTFKRNLRLAFVEEGLNQDYVHFNGMLTLKILHRKQLRV